MNQNRYITEIALTKAQIIDTETGDAIKTICNTGTTPLGTLVYWDLEDNQIEETKRQCQELNINHKKQINHENNKI